MSGRKQEQPRDYPLKRLADLEPPSRYQQQLLEQQSEEPEEEKPKATTGRRVVEIKQAPRRGRGASGGGDARASEVGGEVSVEP